MKSSHRFFWVRQTAIAAALLILLQPLPVTGGAARQQATASSARVALQAAPSPSPLPRGGGAAPGHYLVLIVIDGARPGYLSLPHLPHIDALMKEGVMYDRAWVGQMESTTPGVHVTFGTGQLPRTTGFLNFGWVNPATHQAVDFRALLANGQIDPVLRALPQPSIAERLHQYDPSAISVAASGHKDYATVGLGGGYADYELYGKSGKYVFRPVFMHTPPPLTSAEVRRLTLKLPLAPGAEDRWAFDYAAIVARHVRPRLLMINVPEVDTLGHWYGPDDRALFARLMRNIDRSLGMLEATYRSLGILAETDFIVTADHSMLESRAVTGWKPAVDAAAAEAGTKTIREGDGLIWLVDPTRAADVALRLVKSHLQHVEAIYYRSAPGSSYRYVQALPGAAIDKRAETAFEDLLATATGPTGPDVWVLFRENYTVVPLNVAGTWKGTHGGQTWQTQHVPLLLAGPGFRHGIHSAFPARAVDIAPTVERLLGLPPIQRDGVILADALTDASPAEIASQNTVAPRLSDDVAGLQAQSRADTRTSRQTPLYGTTWTRVPMGAQ